MADAQVAAKKTSGNKVLLYAVGLVAGAVAAQCVFLFIIRSDNAFHKEIAAVIPSHPPAAVPVPLPAPASLPVAPADAAPEESEPAEPALPAFTLSGIFLATDGNYAIVDDAVVKKSDLVKGCTVQDITQTTVELECKAGKVTLSTKSSR